MLTSETIFMTKRYAKPNAFTLFEIIVTVSIVAIIAAVVLPRIADDEKLRVSAASSILVSDLEMAQVMNISFPQDPIVVVFDAPNDTYWLAHEDTPETPMNRPDTGEPYLVTFGVGRAQAATGVTFTTSGVVDGQIAFAAQGGLEGAANTPMMRLKAGEEGIDVSISPTTGTITQQEYDPDAGRGGGGASRL